MADQQLADLSDDHVREQLRAVAHELVRRSDKGPQPYVWYLPKVDPYSVAQLHRRGLATELLFNGTVIVTRLSDAERWALIAWLVAQDPEPGEAAPGTT